LGVDWKLGWVVVKLFIFRSFVFAVLWTLYLYQHVQHSNHLSLLLFISSFAIGSYFLLPIVKQPLILYAIIYSLIILAESLYSLSGNMYSLLLFLYLHVEAIFQLSVQTFRLFTVIHFLCSLVIVLVIKNGEVEWLFAFTIFSVISMILNENVSEREEQKELYEQLLGEYRRLKRLNYETERSARLEERTRIARDIHDSVGHKLTALLMQLEILFMKDPRHEYEELKHLVRDSLEETRHAVRALKTEEHEGISSVLQLIRKLELESHIMVHFTTRQGVLSIRLTNQRNVVLYRVIQEALTNAMRHAQSREVFVVLGKSAVGDLEFSIKNRIFEAKPFQMGFGLINMKQRVEEVGGTLHVFQTNDEFVVQGTLPTKELVS
jgi:signal transduction histidine kinase